MININLLKMRKILVFIMLAGLMVLNSCSLASKHEQYEREEKQKIQDYLNDNPNLTFTLKESGLYYMDVSVGDGGSPAKGDTVYVHYTGYFLDGYKFDSNAGKPAYVFPAGMGWVIPGFDEGIMLMRKGGKAKLLLPSGLAYGNSGYLMPAYTPLLFDVSLDSIVPGVGKR